MVPTWCLHFRCIPSLLETAQGIDYSWADSLSPMKLARVF